MRGNSRKRNTSFRYSDYFVFFGRDLIVWEGNSQFWLDQYWLSYTCRRLLYGGRHTVPLQLKGQLKTERVEIATTPIKMLAYSIKFYLNWHYNYSPYSLAIGATLIFSAVLIREGVVYM